MQLNELRSKLREAEEEEIAIQQEIYRLTRTGRQPTGGRSRKDIKKKKGGKYFNSGEDDTPSDSNSNKSPNASMNRESNEEMEFKETPNFGSDGVLMAPTSYSARQKKGANLSIIISHESGEDEGSDEYGPETEHETLEMGKESSRRKKSSKRLAKDKSGKERHD